ncbi:Rrg8p [Zygosaccharomyces mellis]|uniref:Required for respiratory growth protein 8, mitochondrial n=1 Tax=Zygosaccharomyces mellis TaxID=42258 RepID=A0A4C2E5X0_9SACH|nr:Rrg8p [Zygosaccharomyces mellis]
MPIIPKDLYKNLLINRVQDSARVSILPRVPHLTSPLVTKFEKWSGKRKKLFFKDESQIHSYGIKDFGLSNNLFAQILSSPMRSERNCKTKMPKDFLMQLKLNLSQTGNSSKLLELAPVIQHSKFNKNSYVVNSRDLLSQQMNSSAKWVPMPVLTSQMRYFQVQDVAIDKANFLRKYEEMLSLSLRDRLIKASSSRLEPQSGDVVVCFDEESNKPIEIRRCESTSDKKINLIVFNLKYVGPTWDQLVNEHKNYKEGIFVKFSDDEKTIKLLYRILAYHYTH